MINLNLISRWWSRNGIVSLGQKCQSQLSECATVQVQTPGVQNRSVNTPPHPPVPFSPLGRIVSSSLRPSHGVDDKRS